MESQAHGLDRSPRNVTPSVCYCRAFWQVGKDNTQTLVVVQSDQGGVIPHAQGPV